MDVAGRAPIQRCGLRSSTFQFFAVSSTTVLVKGLLPVAAAIVSESAAAIAIATQCHQGARSLGDVNRGRYTIHSEAASHHTKNNKRASLHGN